MTEDEIADQICAMLVDNVSLYAYIGSIVLWMLTHTEDEIADCIYTQLTENVLLYGRMTEVELWIKQIDAMNERIRKKKKWSDDEGIYDVKT